MGDMSTWPYGFIDDAPRKPKKRIVAIAGRNGSGKETAAKKTAAALDGAKTHTYSDVLIQTFKLWLKRKSTRPEQQKLSMFMCELLGEDAMAAVMTEKCLAASGHWVVIDGVRRLTDLDLLFAEFGRENITLVWIEAPPEIRYQRLKERKEKGGEQFMTWDEFLVQEQAEAESQLELVRVACTREIDNSGTLEQLMEQLGILHHDLTIGPR